LLSEDSFDEEEEEDDDDEEEEEKEEEEPLEEGRREFALLTGREPDEDGVRVREEDFDLPKNKHKAKSKNYPNTERKNRGKQTVKEGLFAMV
jgi:hypothetical protein